MKSVQRLPNRLFVSVLILQLAYFGHLLITYFLQHDAVLNLINNYSKNLEFINNGFGNAFERDMFALRGFTVINSMIVFANLLIIIILYLKYKGQSFKVLLLSNTVLALFVGIPFLTMIPMEALFVPSALTPFIILSAYAVYLGAIIYYVYNQTRSHKDQVQL